MIDNAQSRYEKYCQLLALDLSTLCRPPLSSVSSSAQNGRHVAAQAVADRSVMSCCVNAPSARVLSDRGIDMPGAAGRSRRERRAPLKSLSDSSISRLIADVIESQPGKKALIRDIYRCLRRSDPGYFRSRTREGWQNRVRRLLSRQKTLFIRTSEQGPGCGNSRMDRGYYWRLQSDQALSVSVQPSSEAAPVASPRQVPCFEHSQSNR